MIEHHTSSLVQPHSSTGQFSHYIIFFSVPAGAVPGRPRTKFSAAQLQELERSFREQRYIGAGEKRRLAAVLNLSQSQVSIKTWFQNRRMKFKRQTQDARIEALFSENSLYPFQVFFSQVRSP
uniref:Homeobox domain-containing protein n=1 Tax=Serinus canaria TaxID=9135 RepID=A0A8C9UIM2_SERCA